MSDIVVLHAHIAGVLAVMERYLSMCETDPEVFPAEQLEDRLTKARGMFEMQVIDVLRLVKHREERSTVRIALLGVVACLSASKDDTGIATKGVEFLRLYEEQLLSRCLGTIQEIEIYL